MSAALLAFDTSTENLSVALQCAAGRRVWDGPGGALASATLLPRIRALMDEAAVRWADLSAIAFGCGPGAFTGLRTACAVAQGLAFGASLPVLPIDSLLIVAEGARRRRGEDPRASLDVAVAMDARMGQVYAARYLWDGAVWHTSVPPALCEPADLGVLWAIPGQPDARPGLLAGTGIALAAPAVVAAACGAGVPVIPETDGRASALLPLADQAWRAGRALPPAQALPVYLRDKVALTTAERVALHHGAR
jgi:tRNA threonylcarbamoyladenosine biosynthesis protein TsaB